MPYYLIIALQVFCMYHLYKNKNEYYWVFLIIFLPVLGSIIYLITQVYNKRDAEKIQNEIATIINPSKKVRDLESKLEFSETFQNKVNLADAYFEGSDFKNAILHYENAINKGFQNDYYVSAQIIRSYFKLEDFDKVIVYSEKANKKSEFKKSHIQFLYGLALEKQGKFKEAEEQLRQIDISHSNYEERLAFAKFLIRRDKNKEAKEILNEIYIESQHMIKNNRRKYSATIQEVEQLIKEQ